MNFREVPQTQCQQVCCHSGGGTRWQARASCKTNGGEFVADQQCGEICCKFAPPRRSTITRELDCRDKGGLSAPLAECGTIVEVEKPPEIERINEATEPPPI